MNYVSLILMTNLIPTILIMFAIPFLTEKFGKRNVFAAGLAATGFNAALKVQPEATCNMISMLFIWIPVLMLAATLVIFLLFFDFERKNNKL